MAITRIETEDILNGTIIEEDLADGAVSPIKADLTASWNFGLGSGSTLFYKEPTLDNEVAVKSYVDSVAAGVRDAKDAVKVASSGNLTLSGLQSIDGVTLGQDDRILVFGQTDATENGIYTVSTGSWVRATDADEDDEVTNGLYTYVTSGSVYQSSGWLLISPDPITVDTDDQTYVQVNGGANIVAGDGIFKVGNQLNVGAGTGVIVNPDDVAIDPTVIPFLSGNNSFSGVNTFSGPLTGAILQNASGESYVVAGPCVTVNSASGDQIVIDVDKTALETHLSSALTGVFATTDIGFITVGPESGLTNERVLSGTGITINDGGANGTLELSVNTGSFLGKDNFVFGEVLTPAGAYPQTTFTTANDFTSASLRVYRRGLRMKEGATCDYTLIEPNTVVFNQVVPNADSNILGDYCKE